jgi:hypothetical protein
MSSQECASHEIPSVADIEPAKQRLAAQRRQHVPMVPK